MKAVTEYEAEDGRRFPTKEACDEHDLKLARGHLCGLEMADINSAIDGGNSTIADAICLVRNMVLAAQNARAGKVRKPRAKVAS